MRKLATLILLSSLSLVVLAAFRSGVLAWGVGQAAGGPPGLVFDQPALDLGRIPASKSFEVSLPWHRTGAGSLRVLGVRSDCGCALARGPSGRLRAGAKGNVLVRLAARKQHGPFSLAVRLYSDGAPPADRVLARVRGYVETPLGLRPARLDLGRRTAGSSIERQVRVSWVPSTDLFALAGVSRPTCLAGSSPLSPGSSLRVTVAGIDGHGRVEPPATGDLPGCELSLSLRAPDQGGPFRGEARLLLADRVIATVPLSGTVEPRRETPPQERPAPSPLR